MSGDSTHSLMCARCGLEIGGASIWEGHLAYHPNCAPSAINIGGNLTEDQILAAAGMVWETEKAEVIHRLSTALGLCGSITLPELLEQVEKRLLDWREGRGQE